MGRERNEKPAPKCGPEIKPLRSIGFGNAPTVVRTPHEGKLFRLRFGMVEIYAVILNQTSALPHVKARYHRIRRIEHFPEFCRLPFPGISNGGSCRGFHIDLGD